MLFVEDWEGKGGRGVSLDVFVESSVTFVFAEIHGVTDWMCVSSSTEGLPSFTDLLPDFVRLFWDTRSKNFLSSSANSLRLFSICSGVNFSKSCCLLRNTCCANIKYTQS